MGSIAWSRKFGESGDCGIILNVSFLELEGHVEKDEKEASMGDSGRPSHHGNESLQERGDEGRSLTCVDEGESYHWSQAFLPQLSSPFYFQNARGNSTGGHSSNRAQVWLARTQDHWSSKSSWSSEVCIINWWLFQASWSSLSTARSVPR